MRKNTARVLAAWRAGKDDRRDRSVWTDGRTVYSYATAIMTRDDNGRIVFNATKYSPTTTNHQNGIRSVVTVDTVVSDVPRGASDTTLERLGR